MPSNPVNPAGPASDPREVRFHLVELLEEVAVERQTGAFGQERLRQSDIRRLAGGKNKKPRARRG